MDKILEDQVAIVTGGSTGIGARTAQVLADRGAKVVICARRKESLDETIHEIRSAGGEAIAFSGDVSKKEDVAALFEACKETYGNPDILVSNAGVGVPPCAVEDITEEDIDYTFGVNVKGHIWCLGQCKKMMNDGGRIVVTGSSSVPYPVSGLTTYIASKSALRAIVETTRYEFGERNITINEVLPGLTNTPMAKDHTQEFLDAAAKNSPMGRIGEPDDVAQVIAFLCEKRSQWLTGQHIIANGGANS